MAYPAQSDNQSIYLDASGNPTIPLGVEPRSVAAGDFNQDGAVHSYAAV